MKFILGLKCSASGNMRFGAGLMRNKDDIEFVYYYCNQGATRGDKT